MLMCGEELYRIVVFGWTCGESKHDTMDSPKYHFPRFSIVGISYTFAFGLRFIPFKLYS